MQGDPKLISHSTTNLHSPSQTVHMGTEPDARDVRSGVIRSWLSRPPDPPVLANDLLPVVSRSPIRYVSREYYKVLTDPWPGKELSHGGSPYIAHGSQDVRAVHLDGGKLQRVNILLNGDMKASLVPCIDSVLTRSIKGTNINPLAALTGRDDGAECCVIDRPVSPRLTGGQYHIVVNLVEKLRKRRKKSVVTRD